ncbi:DUF3302 domain-containing protein [Persicirhabdus sediminis]|uniref:DUF3302 domain-containing protein n=2 Tax=Persicirhabdus sediminis TaxID=454144 RepID=A0A8J7MEV1_9BACT|nr:DUF3302 domain-containing protein [Persicirhabdus sediminis]MBK1792092.1 DUF3302 domain-containing protein [Persicirhabdus sediminis]
MLDYISLGILIAVVLVIFYGIIAIHDIPYEIAKKRNHPQQDAILVAGWISLFTLHVLWPFLWIWATLYRADRGWGFISDKGQPESAQQALIDLEKKVAKLTKQVAKLESNQTTKSAQSSSQLENGE